MAGLNPHAGESGSFGVEDQEEILPAVAEVRECGMDVSGPFPPDTIFMQVLKGHYDAVVCMYHDQGHIPMKLLDFEGGINVTLGSADRPHVCGSWNGVRHRLERRRIHRQFERRLQAGR